MKRSDPGLMATRRNFFRNCAGGLGAIAAAQLLATEGRAAASESSSPLAPKKSHFPGPPRTSFFSSCPVGRANSTSSTRSPSSSDGTANLCHRR